MIDEPVVIVAGGMRMSANAMDDLYKATGQTMSDLMGDGRESLKLRVMAFAELHNRCAQRWLIRDGRAEPIPMPDPGELWERAGYVQLDLRSAPLDPLGDGSSTTSPLSADTGG